MLPSEKYQSGAIQLISLKIGQNAKIIHIEGEGKPIQHLSELGLVPGTDIQKLGEAPFGGPIQISVQNSRLAIGKGLAKNIWVMPL